MKNNHTSPMQLSPGTKLRRRSSSAWAGLCAVILAALCALPFSLNRARAQRPVGAPVGVRPAEQTLDAAQPGYVRGELIVMLKPAAAESVIAHFDQPAPDTRMAVPPGLPRSLGELNRRYQVSKIEPLFAPQTASPEALARAKTAFPQRARRAIDDSPPPRLDHLCKFTLDLQADIEQAAKDYAADPHVEFAEPNRLVQALMNDQFYNPTQLWGMFKVQSNSAWAAADGNGVIVAVIDTGVDINHPDLQPNIRFKKSESWKPGVDNDGNGYVADMHGWDFVNNDNLPLDDNGHGTHVAGTIAAEGNNQIGVVGLAHDCRIMPLKALNALGSGSSTNLAYAMLYAVKNGADVINNSWGGGGYNQLFEILVRYAHQNGVVTVSAAGNANQNSIGFFPANIKRSLAVAAYKKDDTRAAYSNFGHQLDVGAPGGAGTGAAADDIFSTFPNALGGSGISTDLNGNKYKALAGTSMAAPHVAGLAALLISEHPTWTNEEIRQAIRRTADDVATTGFDLDSGYGRINAAKALANWPTAPPTALLTEPRNYSHQYTSVTIAGYARAGGGLAQYEVQIGVGTLPTTFTTIKYGYAPVSDGLLAMWDIKNHPSGDYTIRLVTTDGAGQKGEDRVVIKIKNLFLALQDDYTILSGDSFTPGGVVAGNCAPFHHWELDWASGWNATSGFKQIAVGYAPTYNESTLGTWNLTTVPDGPATLRLRAFSGASGAVVCDSDQKNFVIDRLLAKGWPVKVNHAPSFKSPKIADLDSDGTKEIVLGASVYEPDGSLRPGWDNFPGLGRTNPAILRLDGNKFTLEIVAAVFDGQATSPNAGAPVIYAYRHDKSVIWSFDVVNPNATLSNYNFGIPSSISAADVDGDGKNEIVFTMFFSYFNSAYKTAVFVLDAQTGALEQQFEIPGISRSSVALADINADNQADLIIAAREQATNNGLLYVLRPDGSALPGWPRTVLSSQDTQGWGDIDPVVGDVNLDGGYDILVGKRLFNAAGNLAAGWPAPVIARSTGAFGGFPDGDDQLEVVLGGGNAVLYSINDHNGSMKFIKGNGSENLMILMADENGMQGNPIVADLDGDNQVEIIRPSELGLTSGLPMKLYAGESMSSSDAPQFPRYVNTKTLAGSSDIIRSTAAVDDVDQDGKSELVVAAGGQLYLWHLNKPHVSKLSYWPMFQRDLRNTGTLPK